MAEMRSNAFPEPEPQLLAPLQPQERPSTSAAPSSSSREYELLFWFYLCISFIFLCGF